jgi:hypothetical protein
LANALAQVNGQWRLVNIRSGWTGKISKPSEKVNLIVDDQAIGMVYERDKQSWRFHLDITKNRHSVGMRFTIDQQQGETSFYFPTDGYFRVCEKQLIMGNTDVDGVDLIFERIK